MAWIMQSSGPVNTNFITPEGKPFVGDAPLYFFRIDPDVNDGLPYTPLMIGLPVLAKIGAFKDAAELKSVVIPQSCTAIGDYAFARTQLKNATVPQGCTYAETSFPEDCEVTTYGGGYGQLYDGDGYAVVDGNGDRVYINA